MAEQLGFDTVHYGPPADAKDRTAERCGTGSPRLVEANRSQLAWRSSDLDSLITGDHPARLIWAFVQRLDLSEYTEAIRSRDNGPGRPAIDPAILLTLWLYATVDRVGQARRLADLCEDHAVYRWICGGLKPNYHTLSDFRTKSETAIDRLLSETLGVMMHQGIVKLRTVAQDGLRVRASAGKKSFRRRKTLQRCLEEAQARVAALKALQQESAMAVSARERAVAERAAQQREAKVQRALTELAKIEEKRDKSRDKRKRSEPRASTTDGDARVMRMADGGYRPGYNIQLATDAASGMVVGVGVTNGNDGGQVEPMLADIERRLQRRPEEYLADGGFAKLETVEHMAQKEVGFFAPLPQPKKAEDPYAPRRGDSPAVKQWRERMGSEAGKELYKTRAQTAERPNADIRHWRGLNQFTVRGIRKVYCVSVMTVLAFDILRLISLTRGLG